MKKYTTEQLEQMVDKPFIEWMIEDLNPDQLSVLLFSVGVEKTIRRGTKLPKIFLINKLLAKAARVKLRDRMSVPPFNWSMELEMKDLSKDDIFEKAEIDNAPTKELALALYLQNHFEEAMELYEQSEEIPKNINDTTDKKTEIKETEQQRNEEKNNELTTRKEKRFNQKITKLINENSQTQKQLVELKKEMKEKLSSKQQEIFLLNKRLTQEEQEKAQIIKEIDFLKNENDRLKEEAKKKEDKKTISAEPKSKMKKIAFLGNPKNKGILKNEQFQIEIFELEELSIVIDRVNDFEHIYLLTWRFLESEFENNATKEIKNKTVKIEAFPNLKQELEDLSNVK
ncbi:hypothetical protein [Psychrobacillus sp. NPDC093180]|uniref:hypothetical protein n=1 Tax=Psychrobacillus sp. NPDC093180 TaxID=3364489 RepID=UPI0038186D27